MKIWNSKIVTPPNLKHKKYLWCCTHTRAHAIYIIHRNPAHLVFSRMHIHVYRERYSERGDAKLSLQQQQQYSNGSGRTAAFSLRVLCSACGDDTVARAALSGRVEFGVGRIDISAVPSHAHSLALWLVQSRLCEGTSSPVRIRAGVVYVGVCGFASAYSTRAAPNFRYDDGLVAAVLMLLLRSPLFI